MIFIFGIDRYKIRLVEMKALLEIKNNVVRSGNKIPTWYVEERDELDVQEALDKKDKYFMLARAMEDTRGDWSEGFYRVEYAHGRFVVDTEEDKEIDKEISEILERDHEDGRVFRDCEYNYSVLYGKVSEELMKDYATIQEYYSKY